MPSPSRIRAAEQDRRLWIALGISLGIHALLLLQMQHLQALLHGFTAVIHTGENMAMKIDHRMYYFLSDKGKTARS